MRFRGWIVKHISMALAGALLIGFIFGFFVNQWIISDADQTTMLPQTYNECMREILYRSKTDSAVIVGRDYCKDKFPLGGDFIELKGFTPEMFENNK